MALSPAIAQAGDYVAIPILGAHKYAGADGKSPAGSLGYFFDFQTQKKKELIRPTYLASLTYTNGNVTIDETKYAFSLFGAAFQAGFNIFLFKEGIFQPYIGGGGMIAWHQMAMPSPPDGTDTNTQSLSFGYAVNAGVDMRFGSADGNALRIQSSHWILNSKLGGISGFQLSGWRIGIGIVF